MLFDTKRTNDIILIRDELKRHYVRPFYLFYGPNLELMRNYIQRIGELTGLELKYVDSCSSVIEILKQKTFLPSDYIYVVLNDNDYVKNGDWEFIKTQHKKKSVVIFIYTELKKNTKFYKEAEQELILFDAMKIPAMIKSLKKKYNLDDSLCNRLINRCDGDFGRCLLECKKVDIYCNIHNIQDFNKGMSECLDLELITISSLNNVSNLVDSFLDEDPFRCWLYYTIIKRNNESIFGLLWDLYFALKSVYRLQTTRDWKYIDPKLVQRYSDFAGIYSNEMLVYAIKYVSVIDSDIKSGKLEADLAFEKFLVDFFITYNFGN